MNHKQSGRTCFLVMLGMLLSWQMVSPTIAKTGNHCPYLPPPSGPVLTAGPQDNIQNIISTAAPGTTILLDAGLYELSGTTFWILTDGITIRGSTGDREAVILDGGYQSNEIIHIAASNVTIADVTIKRAIHHPIHIAPLNGNLINTYLYNVHIIDPGQQAIKINPNSERTYYPDEGEIACSRIELTDIGRNKVLDINGSCYTGGIDAHQARGWLIRDNEIEGFWCQHGISEHGIHFWRGSRDTEVIRNILTDNARGIGFGLQASGLDVRMYPDDPCTGVAGYVGHYGGLVLNNFVQQNREELYLSEYGFDSGIALAQSCDTRVIHNSIVSTRTPFSSIEYRFSNTSASIINNLVSHNIMKRNESSATLAGNITYASLDNFVDPMNGNLHLRIDSIALDQGVDSGLSEFKDIDGQARMQPPDVGGDENNPGDVNGDGTANLVDTILVLQILSNHRFNSDSIYSQADMNGDGTLGIPDAISILDSQAGI